LQRLVEEIRERNPENPAIGGWQLSFLLDLTATQIELILCTNVAAKANLETTCQ
jgi:hypothetical protein